MSAFLHADWPVPPGVHALSTVRHGLGVSTPPFDHFNLGSRCGDNVDAVLENRRQLQAALHLPSPPRWLRQVHGVAVAVEPGFDEPEADAAVTATPGRVLAILTADCLPVVFASRTGDDIGAAHAGWRGLCAGVLEAAVGAMHTPAQQLMAWLGPAAGPQAYEIGEDVFAAFVQRDPAAAAAFVATRPGHWKMDLYALARQRLQAVGVTAVFGGEQCTISDPARFFSHRRDQRGGRIATLVWMQA
jgi:YfiH family protein